MATRTYNLANLLDWVERLVDNRLFHTNEWFTLFAGEERYIELNFSDNEVWAAGVSNHNLSPAEWLTADDEVLLHNLRWHPEEVGSDQPQYVRRWDVTTPTSEIVREVMQVLTSVYLRSDEDSVEVLRGMFLDDHTDVDL